MKISLLACFLHQKTDQVVKHRKNFSRPKILLTASPTCELAPKILHNCLNFESKSYHSLNRKPIKLTSTHFSHRRKCRCFRPNKSARKQVFGATHFLSSRKNFKHKETKTAATNPSEDESMETNESQHLAEKLGDSILVGGRGGIRTQINQLTALFLFRSVLPYDDADGDL